MTRLGLILAGGGGRRMGGADKALLPLGGRTLVARAAARLAPQTDALAVSAGGDPARFGGLGVLPDPLPGGLGPLAGVLAGLEEAARQGRTSVLTVAVDTPFFPPDLAARLAAAGPFAIAAAGVPLRHHPACALWPVSLAGALRDDLIAGERRLGAWALAEGAAICAFPDEDTFLNINRPEDLARAEEMLAAGRAS
ncbi:molybdenum cofactor guanylyltransferase MobA [Roseicyclus sp. F158]|uniref:Molybdenum cofactor guanylyltransferase n=1 Tax=Tropicimonas omnivorans TaxID=3075590 RepID=A0ABU3DC82_9RHOB|nr:molybdenum cofactor guanylyltransferase MobA [Roseicyclus sp. F158]MDT0681322.1 molybdenum cofactor guanylyltransferase MobA [Roseicyclus sp. F158]